MDSERACADLVGLPEPRPAQPLPWALFHAALNMASATEATEATEAVAPAASAVVIVWAVLILRAEQRRTAGRTAAGAVGSPDQETS